MRFILAAFAAALGVAVSTAAPAQTTGPIKIGLMLPYSGTYASIR